MTAQDSNPFEHGNAPGSGQPPVRQAEPRGYYTEPPQVPRTWGGASLSNILLAAAFAAGVAGLWVLTRQSSPARASAEDKLAELRVDSALSALLNVSAESSRATEVVNTFYYQARQRQIPPSGLRGNPFVFSPPARPKATQPLAKKPPPPVKVEKEDKHQLEEVKKLVLQSVLIGSREPVAMISNNLLTEGQKIAGWTLTKIEPRKVTLTWKDKTYVLRMSQLVGNRSR